MNRHYEARPYQPADHRLPGVGVFVCEHDNQAPIVPQSFVEAAEGPLHTVLVVLFRSVAVAAETAGVVNKLPVSGIGRPLRSQRTCEDSVEFG